MRIFLLFLALYQLTNSQNVIDQNAKYACGISKKSDQIENVTSSSQGSWPWAVAIRYFDFVPFKFKYISGTILSSFYILTNKGLDNPDTYVIPGVADITTNAFRYKVDKIINHPDPNVMLSLLELENPLQFSDNVAPICLPESNNAEIVFNKSLALTGW